MSRARWVPSYVSGTDLEINSFRFYSKIYIGGDSQSNKKAFQDNRQYSIDK